MKHSELARKRRLVRANVGARERALKLVGGGFVVVGLQDGGGERFPKAARSNEERVL